ncbi:CMRF35-like molecule 1 [Centroberyx affinis]|uniref:CMRF35-like molecule 1 n=1 Tax=Centroberyx affinis TaxID=166261 RepID=UPI003A5BE49A
MTASGLYVNFLNAPFLCLLWLMRHKVDSLQLSAPAVVKAENGGSVTISCQYDPFYRDNTKYWCKGQVYELCKIVVKTPKNRRRERCSIVDDKDAGFFNVTVTSLRQSDEGKYWCVISRSGRNVYTGVKLLVSHSVMTPTNTTPTTVVIQEHNEISWWATLRWILFILMLCCLAATHIAVWRINTVPKICQRQPTHCQNFHVYGSNCDDTT